MTECMGDTPRLPSAYSLLHFETLASTNDEARSRAVSGAADGTLVWADMQTAGRGRRGREWVSPCGNLYFSLLLRPGGTAGRAAQLSLVTAVAVGDAVASFLPSSDAVRFKWPNDVLVGGAKVAGILLESSGTSGSAIEWLVLGCGVNVVDAPKLTDYPATSLRAAGASKVPVSHVLERIVLAFDPWRQRWQNEGIGPVRDAWLARAQGLGERIRVRLPDGEIGGRFADIDGDGAMVLETEPGVRRTVTAGDVFF